MSKTWVSAARLVDIAHGCALLPEEAIGIADELRALRATTSPLYGGVRGGGMDEMQRQVEPFIVKHYIDDERPSIKGNGFDGLEIGTDRQYAQEFVDWVNARLSLRPDCPHKTDAPLDAPADPNCSWCNAQRRSAEP